MRHPKYKTEKCKSFWTTGSCRYGTRCKFLHNEPSKNTPEIEEPKPSLPQSAPLQYCFPPAPHQPTQSMQIVSPPPYIEQVPSPNILIPIQYVDSGNIYYPESDYEYNQPINPSVVPIMRKISAPERVINAYTWDQVRKVSSPPILSPNETNSPIPTSLSDPRCAYTPRRKNNMPSEELKNYMIYSDNEKIKPNSPRKSTWNGEMVYDLSDKEIRKSTWPISKAEEDQLNVKISGLSLGDYSNPNYYENDDNMNRLPVFTKLSTEHVTGLDSISAAQSTISELTCSSITTPPFE